jgi:hypothetical protein
MGATYLNESIERLRDQVWYEKVVAMGNRKWRGKGLSAGVDFDGLKRRWNTMAPGMEKKLLQLTTSDFRFQEMVRGETEIRETVSDFAGVSIQRVASEVVYSCKNSTIWYESAAACQWDLIIFPLRTGRASP